MESIGKHSKLRSLLGYLFGDARTISVFYLWFAIPTSAAAVFCDKPNLQPFELAQVRDLITTCRPKNANALISLLPVELRKNFTFVYASGSPETKSVSTQYPRTILFSNDGKFFLAFSGDSHKPDYNQIQFFQSNGPSQPASIGKIEWGLFGKAKISDGRKEENKCVKCHTSDPKLIWGQYPSWPGVYGSEDDNLVKNSLEAKNYSDFIKNVLPSLKPNSEYSRYGQLIFPASEGNFQILSTGPKTTYRMKLSGDLPPYTESDEGDVQGSNLSFRPNLQISTLSTRIDAIRNARLIKQSPNFQRLKDVFIWDGLGCQNFYPSDQSTEIMTAIQREVEGLNQQDPKLDPPITVPFDKYSLRYELDSSTILKNLGFKDASNWAPQLVNPSLTTPSDGYYEMKDLVASLLVQSDAELNSSFQASNLNEAAFGDSGKQLDDVLPAAAGPMLYTGTQIGTPNACTLIAAKFLKNNSLSNEPCHSQNDSNPVLKQVTVLAQPLSSIANPLQNTCTVCHSGRGSAAPRLPFDSPDALAKLLLSRPALKTEINTRIRSQGTDHMPMGANISEDQVNEISDFLDEISNSKVSPH